MNQRLDRVRWTALGVTVLALLALGRTLPLDRVVTALRAWTLGLGLLGPFAFVALYVVATVAFVPGLVLTLAAGAIFGLWVGTAVVSVGSTAGAAAAFLVGRYLARERIASLAAKRPVFSAIDRAIEEGGWRIVALLRLSPAVPFNLQNYLFGLTPVRFWPYALASWLFMLPGTFLYVYAGHLTGTAVGGTNRSVGQWAALGVGLVATLAVTVYVTRLARRKLDEQADLPDPTEPRGEEEPRPSSPVSAALAVLLAIVTSAVAVWATLHPGAMTGLLGPAPAELEESYAGEVDGRKFDHSAFDDLLARWVDADGWVDYEGLASERQALEAYLGEIAGADFDALSRNEKLALLVNAYNAATLALVLDHAPVDSIKEIPPAERWQAERWAVGGTLHSLDSLEHDAIRDHFREPRIHFALVCAAIGCPPLRSEAYQGDRLEEQLEAQTRFVHRHESWVRFDPAAGVLHLTPLYDWYGSDFAQVAGSVLAFVAPYVEGLEAGAEPTIRWLPYDWALNDVGHRRRR